MNIDPSSKASVEYFKPKSSPPPPPRKRELYDMGKDQLVKLVLELEAKLDPLEDERDRLEERLTRENRAALLHERICEMGLADGPLRVQSSDYCSRLDRAIERTR